MPKKEIPNYDLDLDYVIPMIDISIGELKAIIAEAEKIIAENKVDSEKLAIAYLKKAQCLQKIEADIGKFAETQRQTKKIIETALRLSPNMPQAVMQMGKWYQINGNLDRAIKIYTKAIRFKPDYAAAFNNRGSAYSSINLTKAIANLTEAIRIRPFDAVYYFNLGRKYSALGEHEKAIADFTEAIRLKPDIIKAYLLRGQEYISIGNMDKAKTDFDEYLRCKHETRDES